MKTSEKIIKKSKSKKCAKKQNYNNHLTSMYEDWKILTNFLPTKNIQFVRIYFLWCGILISFCGGMALFSFPEMHVLNS